MSVVNRPRVVIVVGRDHAKWKDKRTEQMPHVRVGPQDWEGTMPLLLELLANGGDKGAAYARGELLRLAKAVDANNADILIDPTMSVARTVEERAWDGSEEGEVITWSDAEEMVRTVNGTVRHFCLIGDNAPAGNAVDVPVSAALVGCEYRMVVRFASGQERSYSQPAAVVDDCEDIFLDVDAEVDM